MGNAERHTIPPGQGGAGGYHGLCVGNRDAQPGHHGTSWYASVGDNEKLFVDFNSTVVPGQQLVQLDQATFRAKVVQAEANLDNAHADVKNALANVHNMRASIDNAQAEVASRVRNSSGRVSLLTTRNVF